MSADRVALLNQMADPNLLALDGKNKIFTADSSPPGEYTYYPYTYTNAVLPIDLNPVGFDDISVPLNAWEDIDAVYSPNSIELHIVCDSNSNYANITALDPGDALVVELNGTALVVQDRVDETIFVYPTAAQVLDGENTVYIQIISGAVRIAHVELHVTYSDPP